MSTKCVYAYVGLCYTLPMNKGARIGIIFAIIAAVCSSINTPISKLLLNSNTIGPVFSGGLLYLGAALCACVFFIFRKIFKPKIKEKPLEKSDFPFVFAIGALNAIGVACSMLGLKLISASNAALLSNFEIVITSLVALFIFKQKISPRLWIGIIVVFIACILLSSDDLTNFKFSTGALLVLIAPICWGFGNNFMKRISDKDPIVSIIIEGSITCVLCLMIGVRLNEQITQAFSFFAILGVGIISYGVSLCFYIYAQRVIGAPRTSAFFSLAPFLAVMISFAIFQETPPWWYYIALGLMIIGVWLASSDKKIFLKKPKKNNEI